MELMTPESLEALENKKPKAGSRLFLLAGPEGGFAQEEISLAAAKGFKAVSLGEAILRTETAALAAMAIAKELP
jgi:16S rRNA (uracil1498-N3)-methyltransferase